MNAPLLSIDGSQRTGSVNTEALSLISVENLRLLSIRSKFYSACKCAAYFLSILALWAIYIVSPGLITGCIAVLGLGLVYAHGLELQHEALHGNLFQGMRWNRLFGIAFGLPMFVSFTHYRSYHFHHHRAVGTPRDEELVNYSIASLRSWPALARRAWNLNRIPAFLATFAAMARGRFPLRVKGADQRQLWHEYCLILSAAAVAILLSVLLGSWIIVVVWLLPWLLIAEPMHFLIELPEHIGCDQSDPSILRNTRSYSAGRIWGYLSNHNNMHIEHHLFPTVPAHRLQELHDLIRSGGGHCSGGYWDAIDEIRTAARSQSAVRE